MILDGFLFSTLIVFLIWDDGIHSHPAQIIGTVEIGGQVGDGGRIRELQVGLEPLQSGGRWCISHVAQLFSWSQPQSLGHYHWPSRPLSGKASSACTRKRRSQNTSEPKPETTWVALEAAISVASLVLPGRLSFQNFLKLMRSLVLRIWECGILGASIGQSVTRVTPNEWGIGVRDEEPILNNSIDVAGNSWAFVWSLREDDGGCPSAWDVHLQCLRRAFQQVDLIHAAGIWHLKHLSCSYLLVLVGMIRDVFLELVEEAKQTRMTKSEHLQPQWRPASWQQLGNG